MTRDATPRQTEYRDHKGRPSKVLGAHRHIDTTPELMLCRSQYRCVEVATDKQTKHPSDSLGETTHGSIWLWCSCTSCKAGMYLSTHEPMRHGGK